MSQVGTTVPTRVISRTRARLDGRAFGIALIASLAFPPVLLYAAWKTKSDRQRHWLLTLFVVYFGATLPIVYDPSGAGVDGVRHLQGVHEYYGNLSVEQFIVDLGDIFMLRGAQGSNDPYIHVLSFFIGSVIGIPALFFPIVALVYGYVFTGSLLIIFRKLARSHLSWVVIFLALTFFLALGLDSMQAIRNPTAAWVLIYGILRFHEGRRLRHLVLMASSPLIHFSFGLIALPALLYLLLGNRRALYVALFAMSSLTNLVEPTVVTDMIAQIELGSEKLRGGPLDERTSLDDRLQGFEQSVVTGVRTWRAYMNAGYFRVALDILVYGLILSGAYFTMGRYAAAIFSNGLLMLSASNYLWFLEGATGRIWGVGFLLAVAGFLLWRLSPVQDRRFRFAQWPYSVGALASSVAFVPYFLFHLSSLLDLVSINVIAMPLVVVWMPEFNMTTKELLRVLLRV